MSNIERILIIGFGNIGKRHFKAIKKVLPHVKVKTLHHKKTQEIFNQLDGRFFKLDEAIAYKPQIVLIASPANFHISQSLIFAKNGCNLIIEKPLSDKSNHIKRLIHFRDRRRLIVHICYNLRYDNSLIYFKKCIEKKVIGKIYSIRCEVGRNLRQWRPGTDYRNTVTANSKLGGGVLLELSHEIDYLQWIFGKIISVNSILKKHSELEVDVEDSAYLIMGISPNDNSEIITSILAMDFIRHDNTRQCVVIGEKGSLKLDLIEGNVQKLDISKNKWKLLYQNYQEADETLCTQWNAYISRIKEKGKGDVSIEDAHSVIRVVNAAKKSSSLRGRQIYIKDEK